MQASGLITLTHFRNRLASLAADFNTYRQRVPCFKSELQLNLMMLLAAADPSKGEGVGVGMDKHPKGAGALCAGTAHLLHQTLGPCKHVRKY